MSFQPPSPTSDSTIFPLHLASPSRYTTNPTNNPISPRGGIPIPNVSSSSAPVPLSTSNKSGSSPGSYGSSNGTFFATSPPSAEEIKSPRLTTTTRTSLVPQIELQGILHKKGLLGSWKKCEFKLTARNLLYHPAVNNTPQSLSQWKTIHLDECRIKNAEGLTNRSHSFALFVGDKKTVLLGADNEESKRVWIEALKASCGHELGKMKLLHLLEGMHDCVVVADEKGIIIGFNKAAKKMFGYSLHEVMGKNVNILMPAPYRDLHQSFIQKHLASGDQHVSGATRRVIGRRKDETAFPLEIGLGKIHMHDGKTSFVATMREVSSTSTVDTLHLVETAHTNITTNLGSLTASIEGEFERLKHRIMELEHDRRDLERTVEGFKKKIEYHMRWRELADSVLRDSQRQEINKMLSAMHFPLEEEEQDAMEDWLQFQLQTSLLLSHDMLNVMRSWVPARYWKKPTLLYSTHVHGTSLSTFFSRANASPNLILIRTLHTNHIFGAFCTHAWVRSDRYYGDGECFLFTILPRMRKYAWNRNGPSYFMMANEQSIVVGGGGKGYGLWLDDSLENGTTNCCDTFDNDPLHSQEHFKVAVLEVFTFY
eukprot:TRINITY_DN4005_c0_g1_i2.p1 TRINITY_DN4005_c0_g1~~TRINITY_DN4005_c0_g1_i2.p1  ORF type:complete len:596 (+),score=137.38 TRINITY_DN4005_c0_g1_i2:32-1819(+)